MRGDLLGLIVARLLDARIVVTPVTSNSGIEAAGTYSVTRTRVGSPYVIEGMHAALEALNRLVLGFSAFSGLAMENMTHGPGWRFADIGRRIERAFRYDWRLWSIPEIRDALHDAGFSRTEAYWERTDRKSNEGTGVYYRAKRAPDDPAWVAYVAALP